MRAVLIAFTAFLITTPAFATDPWAENNSAAVGASAPVVAAEAPRSGFGDDFAHVGGNALGDTMDDAAAAAAAIAPASGETTDEAAKAAAITPAAGDEPVVISDDPGEPVTFAADDKENDIVGP